jgi:hypothetical protein
VAEEYDKEFMKRYEEDLNTTLIFVSFVWCSRVRVLTRVQAGLFSAVTSAFIIEVNSQLQPDPNTETATLLRIILYKMDNTAFGGKIPTVPQWSGPPRTIVQVQAILYASLAASLLSAFLAMLGKQWLNRYASIDMRGSSIERSQHRQRKLDGIITWYFYHVMEALPIMLQFALFLLGCALSHYLWRIDTAVASVVLSFTLFGLVGYTFIVIAGSTSVNCPYQTPGAQVLRYLWQKVLDRSTFFSSKISAVSHPETRPGSEQPSDQEVTALDFRCILWMLQTSLDRRINQLTLKFLGSVLMAPGFKTPILMDCLKMFINSVSVTDDNRVVVLRGSEEFAESAAVCLLGALSHSLIVDPKSNILKDIHQQYRRTFPPTVNLQSLPFYHTISAVHNFFNGHDHPKGLDWKTIDPSALGSLPLTHNLVKIAWSQYQRSGIVGQKMVPSWVLHFSLHSLLQDPRPPASIIANCLLVIAIDLGCDVAEGDIRNLDKRYVYLAWICCLSP